MAITVFLNQGFLMDLIKLPMISKSLTQYPPVVIFPFSQRPGSMKI
jgi:hypothetical protein